MREFWKQKGSNAIVVIVVVIAVISFMAGYMIKGPLDSGSEGDDTAENNETTSEEKAYTCPMHPEIVQSRPGTCPKCGMDLVLREVRTGGSLREYELSDAARKLAEVEVSRVERKYVTAEVRLFGRVEYDETRLANITAYFPMRMERLYVDYTGIPVQKGRRIATIYSPELLSAQQELLGAVEAARSLTDNDEFAQATVDAVREKLRLWGLDKQQIEEIVKRGSASDRMEINAPMSGIVINKHVVEGMYLKTGMPIYTIADLSIVWVKLDAYESDLQWLRYGQDVIFRAEAYPGEAFEGKIAFIDPVVNPRTRTVKVRVNVPNEDGRLKPDMFVRGIVSPRVAAGGKVMNTELEGKWISPRHPEVVKDGPGLCDICSIPLVPAEDLGYVTSSDDDTSKPLVISATAALLTGKRAIVYVQLDSDKKNLYEGREIVLGPRAKDYYIVRSGLQEGELVVTNGAFKIDSALQISAKPSMMIPEGGAPSGNHASHGGHEMRTGQRTPGTLDAPESFLLQLRSVETAYKNVSSAVKAAKIDTVIAAFEELEKALGTVDSGSLAGDAGAMWKELSMLMTNDAVEGRYSENLAEAKQTLELLERHIERTRTSFGDVREDTAEKLEVPREFRAQLEKVIDEYLAVTAALASDDMQAASDATKAMKDVLAAIDADLLDHGTRASWMVESDKLKKPLEEMAQAPDIQKVRENFALVSDEIFAITKTFGLTGERTLYRIKCPMAFDNRGATWLHNNENVSNPYFGASMLRCGEVIDMISAEKQPDNTGHRHD